MPAPAAARYLVPVCVQLSKRGSSPEPRRVWTQPCCSLAGAVRGSASGSSSRSRSPARSPAARRPPSIRGPRTGAAARAARAETYPDQRSAGRLGALRRPVVAPAGLHPGKQPARGHQRLRRSRAPAAGSRAPAGWRPGNAARRDRSARAQDAAAERGAEIAGSDPKRGAAQSRWCRRQNPPSQAACGSQGRATKPSGHARQRSCRRQRRLQRSAIHDAEGSACGVLRKDFPSP